MERHFCVVLSLVLAPGLMAQTPARTAGDVSKDHRVTIEEKKYRMCSTEKINGDDCLIVVDRRYPVAWPTIQMKDGKRVTVALRNPLEFETVSLDWTGFSALPGTDQIASVLPLAIPQLKGFAASNVTSVSLGLELPPVATSGGALLSEEEVAKRNEEEVAKRNDVPIMKNIQAQLIAMDSLLAAANTALPIDSINPTEPTLYSEIRAIYEQLNQVTAPIPKPGSGGPGYRPPAHAPRTPDPWTDYRSWRIVLLCELTGSTGDRTACTVVPRSLGAAQPLPTDAGFINALGDIATEQAKLPTTPPGSAPSNPLFDQTTFEGLAKEIKVEMANLAPSDQAWVKVRLDQRSASENTLLARLTVLSSTLTNVQKDFTTYYQNILFAVDAIPPIHKGDGDKAFTILGEIDDPKTTKQHSGHYLYPWFLGRQVAYAVNAINDIATSQAAITPATVKTPLSTVTVLYADPHLETSAGVVVSFVHNRTFANETIANAPIGSLYTDGEVVISETKTDPELLPIVAAHWRVSPEFTMISRRAAVYGTIWAGLNPYSNVPEYGAGPTISWRSLMVSFLYNRAHQTSLVAPQTVNEPVCMPAASSSPPACVTSPAAPVTQTTALNAFAIGLTIRVPTSYAAGTGGVSR